MFHEKEIKREERENDINLLLRLQVACSKSPLLAIGKNDGGMTLTNGFWNQVLM